MTYEKKAPTGCNPVEGSSEALKSQRQYNRNQKGLLTLAALLSCRHVRLINRLLAGPLPRLEADRVIGTTNGPQYVKELRDSFRLQIRTDRVEVIDRDGLKTRPGVYHLEPEGRDRAQALLEAYEARRAA
ncbi:hypothetical protein [Marinobacter sp. F3R08]|uniref:hypothetical protein n=1 Tax=Marinobacter sp. F3R08 TaxID=2841559 RepID=UPI001C09DED0|nr:hypothetical protein [Marinobacter sp. F3R08]MBU2955076.1 hypothetical protein [Marinobacter sp. F3R08]